MVTSPSISVGAIKELSKTLLRKVLLTLWKSFFRPLLDYGDVIYGQPNNESFWKKLETVQYNATLVITGSIWETSKVKLFEFELVIQVELVIQALIPYKELGLESPKSRRWFRHSVVFIKSKLLDSYRILVIKYH